jgi:hypothetical protein
VLKVSQLREILAVRWSVFVIGPAGCGKTELIRVLSKAENLFGEKSTINVLNPKSVTRNELYGYIHPSTREWKDGLLSQIFRDLANCFTVKHEYLLLDGDIDAEWIESMNTVMDDNKTLTLASNERIPLTPPMRLLLEIENMSQVAMTLPSTLISRPCECGTYHTLCGIIRTRRFTECLRALPATRLFAIFIALQVIFSWESSIFSPF